MSAAKKPAAPSLPDGPAGYLTRPPSLAGFGTGAVLFVLGAAVGAAGGLVQGAWFPGGLLLALAGAAGLFRGGAHLLGGRSGAVSPAAGWVIAVLLLTATRPEGDFLFGAGAGAYLFLLGGFAVAVICATLPARRPDEAGTPQRR
jgi:hypothetical protein